MIQHSDWRWREPGDGVESIDFGKIAIGDVFSKYIAIGDVFSAGGTIAIGDLFSGGCFAIGDLFLPGAQLQLAISGELDRIRARAWAWPHKGMAPQGQGHGHGTGIPRLVHLGVCFIILRRNFIQNSCTPGTI